MIAKTQSHLTLEPVELLNHTDKFPENKKIIVSRSLEMHMTQAQCDQAIRNITNEHGLIKHEQSL